MQNVTFAWTAFAVQEFHSEVATACVKNMLLGLVLN